jgi:hypothetical protein
VPENAPLAPDSTAQSDPTQNGIIDEEFESEGKKFSISGWPEIQPFFKSESDGRVSPASGCAVPRVVSLVWDPLPDPCLAFIFTSFR